MLPRKPPLQKLNPKLYPLTAEIITPGSHIPNNKIRMICHVGKSKGQWGQRTWEHDLPVVVRTCLYSNFVMYVHVFLNDLKVPRYCVDMYCVVIVYIFEWNYLLVHKPM